VEVTEAYQIKSQIGLLLSKTWMKLWTSVGIGKMLQSVQKLRQRESRLLWVETA